MNITGYGEMFNYSHNGDNHKFATTALLSEGIKDVIIENVDDQSGLIINNVGSHLFTDCKNLETVVLPATIETIDSFAFSGCKNLKSITYEGSPNAGKKAIDLPPSLKSIGDSAFSGCSSFEGKLDLTGNSDLKEIGSSAFLGCERIASVHIPGTVKTIGGSCFSGCSNLTKAIIEPEDESEDKNIGEGLFNYCPKLEELSLPFAGFNIKNVNTPDDRAYEDVYKIYNSTSPNTTNSLKTINILGGERIPTVAFQSETTPDRFPNLETINIAKSVTIIENGAFSGCSVKNINFAGPVTKIGDRAFDNCAELISVKLNDSISSIGYSAFKGCKNLKKISIPETVEKIGNDAFSGCSSLKEITIPNGITSIPDNCFNGCTSLESIIIPESIDTIGMNAFFGGNKITKIFIPEGLNKLGSFAFGTVINDDFGTVYYGGTEEEWEALKKKQSISVSNNNYTSKLNGNDSIFNANVIFNAKPEDMSSYVASQEEFVPSGDVNGNGKLDLGDALAILQYIANSSKYPLSEEAIKQADVYNTGNGITPMDALAIQQYDAGLIDSLPVYR